MTVNTFGTLKTSIANTAKRSDLTTEIPDFIQRAENRMWRLLRVRAMETQGRMIWKADVPVTATGVAGTANAITLAPSTAATAYAFADSYTFTAEGTNTSTVTVDVSSLGAKDVKKRFEGVVEALAAGDIREGANYRVYYDGTQFLLAPAAAALLPTDFIALRSRWVDASSRRLEFMTPDLFWQSQVADEVGNPEAATIEGDWLIVGPAPDATYTARLDYYRKMTALSADGDTNVLLTNSHEVYLYGALVELAQAKKMLDEALGWSVRFDDVVQDLNAIAQRGQFPSAPIMRSEVPVT